MKGWEIATLALCWPYSGHQGIAEIHESRGPEYKILFFCRRHFFWADNAPGESLGVIYKVLRVYG